ncbi:lipocalin-like domain-containing protein [Litoreibacter roseus]|uniref:Iron ABC transporter permease n=1 Tax=Litoreibacter roseus TaxID=2601869 RepID=A0A6N6JG66_9RHOB|nr:lipocalin-like domain-containing protein [Litoreibacter roseus]GFE64957.1 iron ABC transporter permease [Litoreibacter roseus]
MSAKWLLCLALLITPPAFGQGFAGLGTEADDGFAVPEKGVPFDFPADHGPHPAYRIEWWYVTANLQDAAGNDYGIQWTLFRSALKPEAGRGWSANQLWMGHAGLTTAETHYHAERLGRGGFGQAGVTLDPFEAFIDDWSMRSLAVDADPLSAVQLTAKGEGFSYDLALTADGPLVPQGIEGYSVKSPLGQASYYYSQPFYQVAGTLRLPEGDVEVTGQAWLDREWSSQPLSEDQTGWDWFSLHFEDGSKMMGFALRSDASAEFTSATWIEPDGAATPYTDGALRVTPLEWAEVEGRQVPVEWRIELPVRGIDIQTTPLNPQSWMGTSFPYWEGPISFSGSHTGRGYLEMTGYE